VQVVLDDLRGTRSKQVGVENVAHVDPLDKEPTDGLQVVEEVGQQQG
jgi:hypothetical protein